MSLIKTVLTLPHTGRPTKDDVKWTFHFVHGLATGAATPAEGAMCNGFAFHFLMDLVDGGIAGSGVHHSVAYLLAHSIDRGNILAESFDGLAGGSALSLDFPPGDPEGSAVATDLPSEVALCLSYKADYGTDPEEGAVVTDLPTDEAAQDQGAPATHTGRVRPRARKRGRIYVGPFCTTAGIPSPSRPDGPTMATVYKAAKSMKDVVTAAGDGTYRWGVWSGRSGVFHEATLARVDNAWDTQRGRGFDADSIVGVAL